MDSKDYEDLEEYEERKCYRYIMDSSLVNSVRLPGQLDKRAGTRGILGYVIQKKQPQKASSASIASSHQHENNYEQPSISTKKQCLESVGEYDDVEPITENLHYSEIEDRDIDSDDICGVCSCRYGFNTLIECSYCLCYIHIECYNLKQGASLKGVPRGLFACHGEQCKEWYKKQVQQKKIKNYLNLKGLVVPEEDIKGGPLNEESELGNESDGSDDESLIDQEFHYVKSPSGGTSSSRATNPPSQARTGLQPEVVTTISAAPVNEFTCKVLNAFEAHMVALTDTVKTPFNKTICMYALEIAKSSQADLAAKHVVSKTLASEFRPALRELFLLYGVGKISPDEYGKKGKAAICTVFLDVFSKMTPDQYKRKVQDSLELPLRSAFAKFSVHTLIVNVPRDEVLSVDNRWYFGPDADLRIDLDASSSSAATDESNRLLSFTEWLAREEGPSMCIMDWITSINDQNFSQFPLLDVDPKSGYVQKPNSLFHQMRRATTFTEWISQLYYMILTTFAHISPNALAGSDATLVDRCKSSALLIREGSTTLSDIIKQSFIKSAAVEATFFGTTLFWRLVGEKGKVGETSQMRLLMLFAQRVRRNYDLLKGKTDLKRKVLSVKDMFNPQTTDSQRRPIVADIDADDFSDDDN